jgi:predicted DNA-binding protein (MmcQ/YjbR family)
MTPREITDCALALPEVTEEEPFAPGLPVYKVRGKVFAILHPDDDVPVVTLKCEPSLALELRAQYPGVTPGYHTNKKHWNTVVLDGSVPDDEVLEMVEHAYDRVVEGMPKAVRQRLMMLRTGS